MYTVLDLDRDLAVLEKQGAKVFTVGYSELGRPIKGVFKGAPDGPQLLMQGAIHAREWVTAQLCVLLAENYTGECGLWCIPMVNPDGAMLAQYGLDSVGNKEKRDFLYRINGYSGDFSLWKANARAVDLNVNFNALWGTGKSNVTYPAPANYIGPYPLSESESRTLAEFTEKVRPRYTVSYHARGRVIYYGFDGLNPDPDVPYIASAETGYPAYTSEGSAGGYKDWFVLTTYRAGITVEVGSEGTPYQELQKELPSMLAQNKGVLGALSRAAKGET